MPSVYENVTATIIAALEAGTVPWRQPWASVSTPHNAVSKRAYSGINAIMLYYAGISRGYTSGGWITYRKAAELGGQVRKGERGTLVTFWKKFEPTPDPNKQDGEISSQELRERWMLRHYTLFNVEQVDNLPDKYIEQGGVKIDTTPIEEAERMLAGYVDGPALLHGGDRAFYRPSSDTVRMPIKQAFVDMQSYYGTLFHELVHSTGHSKRLDRGLDTDTPTFGDEVYSKEELIAELGSAFLCAEAGIDNSTIAQSASYLASWIRVLKGDSKLLMSASAAAQKAANHILGV